MWDIRDTQPKETTRDFSINSDTSPVAALGIFLVSDHNNMIATRLLIATHSVCNLHQTIVIGENSKTITSHVLKVPNKD